MEGGIEYKGLLCATDKIGCLRACLEPFSQSNRDGIIIHMEIDRSTPFLRVLCLWEVDPIPRHGLILLAKVIGSDKLV